MLSMLFIRGRHSSYLHCDYFLHEEHCYYYFFYSHRGTYIVPHSTTCKRPLPPTLRNFAISSNHTLTAWPKYFLTFGQIKQSFGLELDFLTCTRE